MINISIVNGLVDISNEEKIAKYKLYDTTRQMYNEYWRSIAESQKKLDLISYAKLEKDIYEIVKNIIPEREKYHWIDTSCKVRLDGVELSVCEGRSDWKILEIPYEQILEYLQNQDEIYEE